MGLPIIYAIIGGKMEHFAPLIKLYKAIAERKGQDLSKMPIAAHSWGWLSDDKEKAIKEYLNCLLIRSVRNDQIGLV